MTYHSLTYRHLLHIVFFVLLVLMPLVGYAGDGGSGDSGASDMGGDPVGGGGPADVVPEEPPAWSYLTCDIALSQDRITPGSPIAVSWNPAMAATVFRDGVSMGWPHYSGWTDWWTSGLTPGWHEYHIHVQDDAWSREFDCYKSFLVESPSPDLVSVNLAESGAATMLQQGQSYRFTATARNATGVSAGVFKSSFAYGYGGSGGTFTSISTTETTGGLGASAESSEASASIVPVTPGTLTIRHCVDIDSQVAESNESNNCSYRAFTVQGLSAPSCSVSSATVGINDSVSWSAAVSDGVAPYVYEWTGTDGLSGNGNSIVTTYGTAGTKSASVRVTDALGVSSGWVDCSTQAVQVTVEDRSPRVDLEIRSLSGGAWMSDTLTIGIAEEVELRWNSSFASTCTGDAHFSTGNAADGSTSVVSEPAAGRSRVYTVSCTGPYGSVQDTVPVRRSGPPLAPTLEVIPERVRMGESATLRGNLNLHTGCTLSGGTDMIAIPDGTGVFSYPSRPIQGETVYVLTCALDTVEDTVYILPEVEHF